MEFSPTIGKIAKALKDFQSQVPAIPKSETNPFFKSKYANLDTVIETIRPVLAANGLSFAQFPDGDGLTTIVMHESGEWMKATMNLMKFNKPQEQGSGLTYGRRYGLSSALGLATDEDNDGNVAPGAAQIITDHKIKAAKDRITILLNSLGRDTSSKNAVELAVKALAGIPLVPENFEEIGNRLQLKIDDMDPLAK